MKFNNQCLSYHFSHENCHFQLSIHGGMNENRRGLSWKDYQQRAPWYHWSCQYAEEGGESQFHPASCDIWHSSKSSSWLIHTVSNVSVPYTIIWDPYQFAPRLRPRRKRFPAEHRDQLLLWQVGLIANVKLHFFLSVYCTDYSTVWCCLTSGVSTNLPPHRPAFTCKWWKEWPRWPVTAANCSQSWLKKISKFHGPPQENSILGMKDPSNRPSVRACSKEQ